MEILQLLEEILQVCPVGETR